MPDRLHRILQAVTLGLLAVIAFQFVGLILRRNPLAGLEAPRAPRWQLGETNAAAGSTNKPAGDINALAAKTNLPASGTNITAVTGTNTLIASTNNLASNNIVAPASTNLLLSGTNLSSTGTNASASVSATNGSPTLTNAAAGGTNSVSAASNGPPARSTPPMVAGPPPFGRGMNPRGPRSAATPFSPLIQARIDRITQSEVLAPVFHPPPMALLGIAGRDAFIRTPSGQSTLLREGAESDGIKLLRLGTNRVLIEQGGEKKELIIFEGLGSESLLPK